LANDEAGMTPTYTEMFRVFGRIGLLSFGGPAAQIGLMHKELVEDRDWLSHCDIRRMASKGHLRRAARRTIICHPRRACHSGTSPRLYDIREPAMGSSDVLGRQGHSRHHSRRRASQALFVFAAPFPLVILIAAIIGGIGMSGQATPIAAKLSWSAPLKVVILGSILWALPITLVAASGSVFLTDIGLFFSKLAVVSFGGAYAVLAYMTQTVVADYGWITTQQMMDALGLAETTPGPLILV